MIEVQYIVSIAAGGLFGLLFLIWFFKYIYNKSKENERARIIAKMYNDENLAKMDYDFASYDEATARMVSVSRTEGQLSIDDVILDSPATAPDEGIEEITGNYKPD